MAKLIIETIVNWLMLPKGPISLMDHTTNGRLESIKIYVEDEE